MDPAFPRAVTIYGAGLIGGSFALALKKHFPNIRVFGIDKPDILARANALGVIDFSQRAEIQPDLIILATPVSQILEILDALKSESPLILDVGSTKTAICEKAESRNLTFIGGHPMTGAEKSGPEFANAELFYEAPFFLCPGRTVSDDSILAVKEVVRAIGAVPIVTTPADHDRIVAQISHLPQVLSTLLADQTAANRQFAGPGVRSMTRLAASPFHVWRDIFETSGSLPNELRIFIERLRSVLDALEAGDFEKIQNVFERANRSSSRDLS